MVVVEPVIRRFDQILPSYTQYDAIGTDVFLIKELLESRGFVSQIFSQEGSSYEPISRYSSLTHPKNFLLHHFSVGCDIPLFVAKLSSFLITRYHNITPAQLFSLPRYESAYMSCQQGRAQLPLVASSSQLFWSASHYNSQEICSLSSKTDCVFPVLRRYDQLLNYKEDPFIKQKLTKYSKKNLLFVGRLVPNKAAHDALFYLSQYQKYVHPKTRLILVGKAGNDYGDRVLPSLAEKLGLTMALSPFKEEDFAADVLLANHATDEELATYYRRSDVFLCLSDHEGFCVPLVEAMHFGLPLVVHESSALPETAGHGAFIVDKYQPMTVMRALTDVLEDPEKRAYWQEQSLKRSKDFSWDNLEKSFDKALETTLKLSETTLNKKGA